MEVILLLAGLTAGAVIGYFIAKNSLLKKGQDLAILQERLNSVGNENNNLKEELKEEREKANISGIRLAEAKSDLNNMLENFKNQKQEVETLQKRFQTEFENIAQKIFEEKTKKFTEQNKVNLEDTLKPLRDRLGEFQRKVEDVHTESVKNTSSLVGQIKILKELNEQMSKDAINLTKALKGETKTQGNWGEMILENILEKSGLVRDIHFRSQVSITNETGKRLQPDIVIYLPDNKNIIIDSKVSLVAYEKLWNTDDDAQKSLWLKEHVSSIRKHIKELSEKNYQALYQIKTLDFVLMFVPIEPAYLLAINSDFELWNYAYEKNIILLGPTNLLPALRLISSMWKIENYNKNAREIARQSGELYDKFYGFIQDLITVGSSIDKAKLTYVDAMNKLTESRKKGDTIVGRIENLKKLGADTTKSLPPLLIERAEANDLLAGDNP